MIHHPSIPLESHPRQCNVLINCKKLSRVTGDEVPFSLSPSLFLSLSLNLKSSVAIATKTELPFSIKTSLWHRVNNHVNRKGKFAIANKW